MRASDYHRPSAVDPNQIVATRLGGGRTTLQVLDVGDHRYRLTEAGTIRHAGIDPWATASPPAARQIRTFLRPRHQAFAASGWSVRRDHQFALRPRLRRHPRA